MAVRKPGRPETNATPPFGFNPNFSTILAQLGNLVISTPQQYQRFIGATSQDTKAREHQSNGTVVCSAPRCWAVFAVRLVCRGCQSSIYINLQWPARLTILLCHPDTARGVTVCPQIAWCDSYGGGAADAYAAPGALETECNAGSSNAPVPPPPKRALSPTEPCAFSTYPSGLARLALMLPSSQPPSK